MSGTKHFLFKAAELPAGQMRAVTVTGVGGICVYHTEAGFFASEDSCTHGVAPLVDGYIDGNMIYCPYHGGAFEISTGKPMVEPCTEPLRTYRIVVEGDDVLLEQ